MNALTASGASFPNRPMVIGSERLSSADICSTNSRRTLSVMDAAELSSACAAGVLHGRKSADEKADEAPTQKDRLGMLTRPGSRNAYVDAGSSAMKQRYDLMISLFIHAHTSVSVSPCLPRGQAGGRSGGLRGQGARHGARSCARYTDDTVRAHDTLFDHNHKRAKFTKMVRAPMVRSCTCLHANSASAVGVASISYRVSPTRHAEDTNPTRSHGTKTEAELYGRVSSPTTVARRRASSRRTRASDPQCHHVTPMVTPPPASPRPDRACAASGSRGARSRAWRAT